MKRVSLLLLQGADDAAPSNANNTIMLLSADNVVIVVEVEDQRRGNCTSALGPKQVVVSPRSLRCGNTRSQ